MTGKSLIDVGGLAKPATALINRVSDAIGGIAKPGQIVRVAKAEGKAAKIEAAARAEVAKIEAATRIEISAMEARGLRRMVTEEGINQKNIEDITAKAILHLSADAEPEELDQDFIRRLFDRARLTSDDEMQELWAKVLAGEANAKGSYSKRTVDVVSQLEKSDAELFGRFCSYVWEADGPVPFVYLEDKDNKDREPHEIVYSELLHLDDIGLISFSGTTRLIMGSMPEKYKVKYFGIDVYVIDERPNTGSIDAGHVALTIAGSQLSNIVDARGHKSILNDTLQAMLDQGLAISLPVDARQKYDRLAD